MSIHQKMLLLLACIVVPICTHAGDSIDGKVQVTQEVLATIVSAAKQGDDRSQPETTQDDPQTDAVAYAMDALDYASARQLLLPLAITGSANAQFKLAELYYLGEGGAANSLSAYFLYSLASLSKDKTSLQRKDQVKNNLSPDELTKINHLVAQWHRGTPMPFLVLDNMAESRYFQDCRAALERKPFQLLRDYVPAHHEMHVDDQSQCFRLNDRQFIVTGGYSNVDSGIYYCNFDSATACSLFLMDGGYAPDWYFLHHYRGFRCTCVDRRGTQNNMRLMRRLFILPTWPRYPGS